jgi:hypothetical protein
MTGLVLKNLRKSVQSAENNGVVSSFLAVELIDELLSLTV